MTLNYRQKAWAALAGIIAVIGASIYFIIIDVLNAGALIVVAFGCYPWAKYIWQVLRFEHRNTVRVLKSALPKCGFSIEDTEWNDDKTAVRFHGKYQGDNFMVEAYPSSAYVMVFDMPWSGIKASDPSVPRLLEAINETNAEASNMSVYLMDPDEDGVRNVYTLSKTILPSYQLEQYLDSLMCDMLNRKKALHDNFGKERPWMTQRRGPVGFNVQSQESNGNTSDENLAAKSSPTVQ